MKLKQSITNFGRQLCACNISATLFIGVLLGTFVLTNASDVFAQRKKKRSPVKKANSVLMTENIESYNTICIPQQTEDLSIIEIDANSKLIVMTRTKDGSKTLANAEPLSSLSEILSRIDKKSVITFKADPTLSFNSVADALRKIRRVAANCVNVEAATRTKNQYVYIAPEPLKDGSAVNIKPNPLTLVVELKSNKKITLNNGDEGSLNDTSLLSKHLKEIFSEREKYGAFREGTNEVEKTVFVKAPLTVNFADVIRVIEAIKEGGASPVGLQIDDLGDSMMMPSPPMLIKEKP